SLGRPIKPSDRGFLAAPHCPAVSKPLSTKSENRFRSHLHLPQKNPPKKGKFRFRNRCLECLLEGPRRSLSHVSPHTFGIREARGNQSNCQRVGWLELPKKSEPLNIGLWKWKWIP